MRNVCVFGALLFLLAFPAGAGEIEALGWISGSWAGTHGGVRQLEYWSDPDGGLILGVHRDVFDDGRSFFEYLRIEQRGDEIVYVAMPRGSTATDFVLTSQSESRAVFENPEHDYPTKIVYERDGDTLSATISGPANGEIRSSGWSWRRVKPN